MEAKIKENLFEVIGSINKIVDEKAISKDTSEAIYLGMESSIGGLVQTSEALYLGMETFIGAKKELKHEVVHYSCDHCAYKATERCHLKRHVESIHEGVSYSCDYCEFKANGKECLKRHEDAKHKGVYYQIYKKRFQVLDEDEDVSNSEDENEDNDTSEENLSD